MLTVHNTALPWPRTCDTCRAAASAVYCRADLAYLCLGCDAEIHSANPLARRHHRVPIGNHSGGAMLQMIGRSGGDDDDCSGFLTVDDDYNISKEEDDEDELETASWLVDKGVFGEEVDEYLDLEEYSTSCENENWEMNYGCAKQAQQQQQQNYSYGGDCVVPIQTQKGKMKKEGNDMENPAAAAVAASIMSEIRHMEVGVVPEYYNSNSVISSSRAPKGTIDLFTGGTPVQVMGMDREARVLRYKEKKKNRKFEKTIRYASRKAYAETRPRIKGRFAKRRDDAPAPAPVLAPVDHHRMFPYGIIPSF